LAFQIPKRKPKFLQSKPSAEDRTKPTPQAKKFVAFSENDTKAIEAAYQAKLEELEDGRTSLPTTTGLKRGTKRPRAVSGEEAPNTSLEETNEEQTSPGTRVPVNEDFLFVVEI
jgi:hypothetical protein